VISLKHLDLFAHRSGLADRTLAEREVLLTYTLQSLHEAGLSGKLAFKGGTCLRKMVFGEEGRFSEDLDFTLRAGLDRDDVAQEVLDFFDATEERRGVRYQVDDWYVTDESFGGRIAYAHVHTSRGLFKLDISFREAPTLPVLPRPPVDQGYFRHLDFEPAAFPALHEHELVAEKLRAAYQRSKVRDLFDLFLYLRGGGHRVDLLRSLLVLKLWQVQDPFVPETLLERLEAGRYDWDDLARLLRPGQVPAREDVLRVLRKELAGLHDLTELERDLVADARQGWNVPLADRLRARVHELAGVQ